MADVLSRNLFALLDDNGDDAAPATAPAPVQQASQPATQRAPRSNAPRSADQSQQQQQQQPSTRGAGRGSRGRGGAGRGNYEDRVDRPERSQRAPRFQKEGGNGAPAPEGGFERRDSGRGGSGFRGGRRGTRGGGGSFRGREYERRSGTGIEDSEKKEVAGKGTWGDDAEAQVEAARDVDKAEGWGAPADDAAAAPAEGWGESKDAAAGDVKPEEKKEEEPVGKTLAEYQAELAAKRASLAVASIRPANEGVDSSKWADSVKFSRADEEDILFVGKEKAKKEGKVKERPVKIAVEIEQKFSDEERRGGFGGRGRGGRGRGGDDRRGRGAGRSGSGRQQQYVNIDDEKAFPSLSK